MRIFVIAAFALLAAPDAHADVKASFVGPGTYATKEGCAKLEALAKGADRNAGTVPETLTEDGFKGWEGACTFVSFTETVPGKKWKAAMDCHEGAQAGPESDIFERLDDGTIRVTVMDNPTILERCSSEEGR